MEWVNAFLVTIACGALASCLYVYVRYRRWPLRRWKDRVLQTAAEAQRQVDFNRRDLDAIGPQKQREAAQLRDHAFAAYLASIPVNELDAFPGIGPATISRLLNSGYATLDTLAAGPRRVEGLGEKRLADIAHAVRQRVDRAQAEFAAGTPAEARALTQQLQQLASAYDERRRRCRARLAAAEGLLRDLQNAVDAARRVTLLGFVWAEPEELVPSELRNAPLPDVMGAMIAAEDKMATHDRRPQVPAHEPPAGSPKSAASKPAPAVHVVAADHHSAATKSPAARFEPAARSGSAHVSTQASHSLQRKTTQPAAPETDSAIAIMELTIQFAFAAARIDGPVTRDEKEFIRENMRRRYERTPALDNRAKAFCAYYETAAIDVDSCLMQICESFTVAHRAALIHFAHQMNELPGGNAEAGWKFLEAAARRLSVRWQRPQPAPTQNPTLVAPTKDPVAQEHGSAPNRAEQLALLELDAKHPLSPDLVRRHFRLLSERYAPDKVASMGPDFIAMADAKRNAVSNAARSLLAEFGEKLEEASAGAAPAPLRHNADLDAVFGV